MNIGDLYRYEWDFPNSAISLNKKGKFFVVKEIHEEDGELFWRVQFVQCGSEWLFTRCELSYHKKL
tara:strand:- start:214 stop:411 length:198 start_codon:yes stop_codon:yes gene_type:complete